MAYCRFSDGDIYLVKALANYLECIDCRLSEPAETQAFRSIDRVVRHLEEHIDAGHKVPLCSLLRAVTESLAEWIEKRQGKA